MKILDFYSWYSNRSSIMKDETVLAMEEAVPLQEKETSEIKAESYSETLPPHSTKTNCNNCNVEVTSVVSRTLRSDIWVWPFFFLTCGFIPCFCYIYPIRNWFMEWRHYCGKCGKELALYKEPLTIGVKKHLIWCVIVAGFPALLYIYIMLKYLGFVR